MRAAARWPTNVYKVSEVMQGLQESPARFLECLREAYLVFTPIDLDTAENQRAINIAFVTQSAQDIRRTLQKLECFEGMNRSEQLEIAQKVFNNRDTLEDK